MDRGAWQAVVHRVAKSGHSYSGFARARASPEAASAFPPCFCFYTSSSAMQRKKNDMKVLYVLVEISVSLLDCFEYIENQYTDYLKSYIQYVNKFRS